MFLCSIPATLLPQFLPYGVLIGPLDESRNAYEHCLLSDEAKEYFQSWERIDLPDYRGLIPGVQVKAFEIRDAATRIEVLCMRICMEAIAEPARWLLREGGWGAYDQTVYMLDIHEPAMAAYDPFKQCSVTRASAHGYIQDNWDGLQNGQVIDLEFIHGITTVCKESDRYSMDLCVGGKVEVRREDGTFHGFGRIEAITDTEIVLTGGWCARFHRDTLKNINEDTGGCIRPVPDV